MNHSAASNEPQGLFSLLGTTYFMRPGSGRGRIHDIEMERVARPGPDSYLTTDPYL